MNGAVIGEKLNTGYRIENEAASGASLAGRLDRVQYLRAIAAFAVVVWHATYHLWDTRGDRRLLDVMPQLGAFGVTLFFVISGYLMATLAKKSRISNFLAHRVIRIYPIYWLSLLGFYLVNEMILGFGFYIDWFAILLIPGGPWPYKLGVEWTLPFELIFYVMVFLIMLIRLQRHIQWIAVAWGLIVLGYMFAPSGLHSGQFPPLPYLLFSQWILPFIGGIFVAKAGWTGARSVISLVTGTLITILALLSESKPLFMAWLLTIGSMLLVAWATSPDQNAPRHWAHRSIVKLGDWSYALYLCHNSILLWIYKLAPVQTPNSVLWLAAISAPVLASIFLGRADMAMYGLLKRKIDTAHPAIPVLVGALFLTILLAMSIAAALATPRSQ